MKQMMMKEQLGCIMRYWMRWLFLALGCGILAALACVVLVEGVTRIGTVLTGSLRWLFAPLIGATVFWTLLKLTGFTLHGTGTNDYIMAVHEKASPLGVRAALAKLLATLGVVGWGGSGGLAGPSLFIGAGLAQSLARWSHPTGKERRYLHIMGGASMLGALLLAPLAAAVLASEILYRQTIRLRELPYALTGSMSGYIAYRAIAQPTLTVAPSIPLGQAGCIFGGLLAAVLASGLGILLVLGLRVMSGCQLRAEGLLFAGAIATGLLGVASQGALLGWGVPALMAETVEGTVKQAPYIWLAAGKVMATVATVGSGASGGLIGPALVMGGWSGQAVAAVLGTNAQGLMWAGMAAGLATISNVPWAAAILMVELFGVGALPYAVMGSGTGFILARSWVAYGALALVSNGAHTRDGPVR